MQNDHDNPTSEPEEEVKINEMDETTDPEISLSAWLNLRLNSSRINISHSREVKQIDILAAGEEGEILGRAPFGTYYGITDKGIGYSKEINQDSIAALRMGRPRGGESVTLMVADGMGGHGSGESASALVLSEAMMAKKNGLSYAKGLEKGRDALDQLLEEWGVRSGTTALAFEITKDNVHIRNVGDGFVYIFRENGEFLHMKLLKGEDKYSGESRVVGMDIENLSERRNLTMAVLAFTDSQNLESRHIILHGNGIWPNADFNIMQQSMKPEKGDIYIAATDGLDNLTPGDVHAVYVKLKQAGEVHAETLVKALYDKASDNMRKYTEARYTIKERLNQKFAPIDKEAGEDKEKKKKNDEDYKAEYLSALQEAAWRGEFPPWAKPDNLGIIGFEYTKEP